VTSQTTARVNITIAGNAAIGSRVMSIVTHTGTGDEDRAGHVQRSCRRFRSWRSSTRVRACRAPTVTVNLVGSYTGFQRHDRFSISARVSPVLQSQVFGGLVAQSARRDRRPGGARRPLRHRVNRL
jgi:hypothetical protein